MNNIYQIIGGNIKSIRLTKGLTQSVVAESADIVESFYGQIERGAAVASIKTLVSISRALGTDISSLLKTTANSKRDVQAETISRMLAKLSLKDQELVNQTIATLCRRLAKN